jgi:hypothetical protein
MEPEIESMYSEALPTLGAPSRFILFHLTPTLPFRKSYMAKQYLVQSNLLPNPQGSLPHFRPLHIQTVGLRPNHRAPGKARRPIFEVAVLLYGYGICDVSTGNLSMTHEYGMTYLNLSRIGKRLLGAYITWYNIMGAHSTCLQSRIPKSVDLLNQPSAAEEERFCEVESTDIDHNYYSQGVVLLLVSQVQYAQSYAGIPLPSHNHESYHAKVMIWMLSNSARCNC